jgi:hypothetical protein
LVFVVDIDRCPLALAAELPLGALWAVHRDLVVDRQVSAEAFAVVGLAFNAPEIRVHRPRM